MRKQKLVYRTVKSNKGITLISLIMTVILLIIVAGTTVYTSVDRLQYNNLKKMYNDIELLNDKVNNYYIKYGGLPIVKDDKNNPIKYTYTTLNFNKNVNDNTNYYIIDLAAIGNISLNYGKVGYEKVNNSDDVYIINEKSHTIYYVLGIEHEGNKQYTIDLKDSYTTDTIPPTKPQINIVEGESDSNKENTDTVQYYTSSVTIEFVSGKDNWSGINKTTYKINDGNELDISTLENNRYTIKEKGTYNITIKSYDNSNNISTQNLTIYIN